MLADEVNDGLSIDMGNLACCDILLQVELDVPLLEVMVVHLNVSAQLLA
jgi:hypothetical protein